MNLTVETERIPLEANVDGILCVAGTRVTLDSVVLAFDGGATPEEIVYQYPTLGLADVYGVVSYVLNHRTEVQAYLRQRDTRRCKVRQRNQTRFVQNGIRARLLARRVTEEKIQDASACG